MKTKSALAMLLALTLALGATGSAAAAKPAGDLYLLQSSGGTLSGSKLVLHGVGPVTSFTDRPVRSSSSLPEQRFARDWDQTFAGSPPNAALEVAGAPADRDVALIELRDPRYDARHHTLTYTVKRLRQTGDPALASFDRRGDGNAVKWFGRSSLFIDNGLGEAIAVTLEVSVPAGSAVQLTLTDTEFELARDGIDFNDINSPAGPGGPPSGDISLSHQSVEFKATGSGGELRLRAILILTELRGENLDLTGAASVPAGARLVLTPATTQAPHTLGSGPFDISLE